MKLTVFTAAQLRLAAHKVVPAKKSTAVSRSRQYLTGALLSLAVFTTSPAFAKDPCKTVLCMFGKFTGNSGGSECRSAEKDYFSIKIKKRGKIKWSRTAAARGQFLNSCPAADKGITKKINDKFGKVLG